MKNNQVQVGFSDEFTYDNLPIKYDITTDGHLGLYVEDCAKALGVVKKSTLRDGSKSITVRYDRVYEDLLGIERIPNVGNFKNLSKEDKKLQREAMKVMTITERELYLWSFRVDTEQGKKFREWLANIVLPSLRQHGIYITGMENMNSAEIELAVQERTEAYILRKFGIGVRRELTDAIKEVINPLPHEASFVYGGYTNMVYKILFSMTADEYKQINGLGRNQSIRDYMKETDQSELLNRITKAEDFMCSLLRAGVTNKDTMQSMLTNWFNSYKIQGLIN